MPEVQGEPGPAPQGRPEVGGSAADAHEVLRAVPAGSSEPIFHPEPIRIPFDTAPAEPGEPSWSRAASWLLLLAVAAWTVAAIRHPEPPAVAVAMGFAVLAAADLLVRWRS